MALTPGSPCYPRWGSLTGTWRSYTQTWRALAVPVHLAGISGAGSGIRGFAGASALAVAQAGAATGLPMAGGSAPLWLTCLVAGNGSIGLGGGSTVSAGALVASGAGSLHAASGAVLALSQQVAGLGGISANAAGGLAFVVVPDAAASVLRSVRLPKSRMFRGRRWPS